MTDIILNERLWAQNAIANNELGDKPGETLMRVSKYYYAQGYKKGRIESLLREFVVRCDPSVCIYKWDGLITQCAANAGRYPLIDIPGVSITAGEMDIIKGSGGWLARRLLFALTCLAKYGNAVNPQNGNWVNRPPRDIFTLANIKTTVSRQSLMINDLWQAGLVGYSSIVDNINLNVKIIDPNDTTENVLFVTDFRSLGNQYMMAMGESYMACQNCGIIIKKASSRQKYCPDCAVEINILQTIENRRKAA